MDLRYSVIEDCCASRLPSTYIAEPDCSWGVAVLGVHEFIPCLARHLPYGPQSCAQRCCCNAAMELAAVGSAAAAAAAAAAVVDAEAAVPVDCAAMAVRAVALTALERKL
eukprot:3175655-Amphidinium_carterae.1